MSIPTITREYRFPEYKGSQSLKLTEASLAQPKANEVLVKIHAVSLQFRDLAVANGQYPLGHKENVVPCSDAAGEVIAIGQDVTAWKVGDRVMPNFAIKHIHGDLTPEIKASGLGAPIDGVLCEYKSFPSESLVRIPDFLSYDEASTLPCAGLTAYAALLDPIPVKAGDYVLAIGTGGVSIFAVQIAVASGATVICTSSSDEKLEKAKQLGAHHLINYKTNPDWDQEVLKITGGRGVDHVIEVGGPGTLVKSISSVRMGGQVHVIGFVAGQSDISAVPGMLVGKAVTLHGILVGSVAQFEAFNRLIVANNLKPLVDKVFEFEEAKAAYDYLTSQQHVGKVVIRVAKA